MEKILLVDDDKNILKVLKMRLEAETFKVFDATNIKEAMMISSNTLLDLAIVDLKIGREDGVALMETLLLYNPDIPVIILTAFGSVDSAVAAMKKGAYSYLTKPYDYSELIAEINKCLDKNRLSKEIKLLKKTVKQKYGFESIIGKSKQMEKVLDQVGLAALTDSNVCIYGESGTGKELIAKTLHVASLRSDGPFVAINCAAIPENLIESELFGYEKGAFSGAAKSRKGLLAQANKGSFFLDEISEMPLTMQAKLLRVLEEREFYPLGSTKIVKIDTRIISASNKDLEQSVKEGFFRKDLFYRLFVIPIYIPALRDRKEEIPKLAKHFLSKHAKRMNKNIKDFSRECLQKLILHSWPGNIRELQNTIECAVALSRKNIITDDLIFISRSQNETQFKTLKNAKEEFEKKYIIQLIELTKGNVSQAAKLAGKYRADFYELLKKYDLKPDNFRIKKLT
jgi:two-component system response regulator GlrR